MNIEQKAHDLAVIASKIYIDNNLKEYFAMNKSDILNAIVSDLSSVYDDAYSQIIKNSSCS